MRKSEQGFSHVVLLLVAVLLVGGSGYVVYVHQHDKTVVGTTTSSKTGSGSLATMTNQPKTATGAADAVDTLATSLVNSESTLNSQTTTNDTNSDANLGVAANNLGGSYDANNY